MNASVNAIQVWCDHNSIYIITHAYIGVHMHTYTYMYIYIHTHIHILILAKIEAHHIYINILNNNI